MAATFSAGWWGHCTMLAILAAILCGRWLYAFGFRRGWRFGFRHGAENTAATMEALPRIGLPTADVTRPHLHLDDDEHATSYEDRTG